MRHYPQKHARPLFWGHWAARAVRRQQAPDHLPSALLVGSGVVEAHEPERHKEPVREDRGCTEQEGPANIAQRPSSEGAGFGAESGAIELDEHVHHEKRPEGTKFAAGYQKRALATLPEIEHNANSPLPASTVLVARPTITNVAGHPQPNME